MNYSANASIWPGYIPFNYWLVANDLKWNFDYFCSDSLAREINEAIVESENPDSHTTYNTIEEFLNSLRNR